MKRLSLLLVGILSLPFFSYSGGIVHNTNQSASWVRMFARDASTDIDAVFYNPAGLTKLDDGFYLSLNSQTLTQNRTITSNYTYLAGTPVDFEGSISAPVFPGVYAAYKTGKFAISLGVNPVGGGGGATFDKGLPSFEMGVSDLVPMLSSQGVTAYSLDAYLEGTSVFWGFQLGASYEINDMFSVYLGARYVTAKNTYNGHLKDIMITLAGTETSAAGYFEGNVTSLQPLNDGLNGLSAGGAGALTLDQALGLGAITPAEYTSLAGGYAMFGLDPAVHTIDQGYDVVNPTYNNARRAAYVLADQEDVEVEQTGSGITPIIGVNISPNNKLNIALKYEFKTKIELENNTTKDFIIDYDPVTKEATGMFPNKEKFNNDMPAFLSVGVDYKITDKLNVASGFHYWFDKSADYGHKDALRNAVKNEDIIDKNYWEWNLGVEYAISEKILISAGYNRTQTGVKEEFQSDLDYSLSSNSIGLGGAYAITPNINANLGIAYTKYVEGEKNFTGNLMPVVNEKYNKDNLFFGIGLDFKFGGKSE